MGAADFADPPVPSLICKAAILDDHRLDSGSLDKQGQLGGIHVADADPSGAARVIEGLDRTPYCPICLSQPREGIGTMQQIRVDVVRPQMLQGGFKGLLYLFRKGSSRI